MTGEKMHYRLILPIMRDRFVACNVHRGRKCPDNGKGDELSSGCGRNAIGVRTGPFPSKPGDPCS